MSGQDGGGFNSPDARSSGATSPARSARSAQIILDDQTLRDEQLARRQIDMDARSAADLTVRMEAFEAAHHALVRDEHLAEMEQLRVELSTIVADDCAQTRLLPRPSWSGEETTGVVKTLGQILDTKVLAAFGRTHQFDSQMSLAKQKDIFIHMIASAFSSELNWNSWDSAMRGSEAMMDELHSLMSAYLADKPTINLEPGQPERQIVFAYFHGGAVVKLDAKDHHHYLQVLHDLKTKVSDVDTGSVLEFPVLPYYDKENEAYMPHKYLSRALWHHACEILYQALLKFYRQQDGPQLPGFEEVKGLDKSYFDGGKYQAAWSLIETFNGRNTAVDFVTVHRALTVIEFNPKTNNFLLFLKALQCYRAELYVLDPRETRITDDDLLERAKNALIRAYALGDHRPVDNDNFNNRLAELAEELVRVKTSTGEHLLSRHQAIFATFASLYAFVQLLAQRTNTNVSGLSVPSTYVPETSAEFVPGHLERRHRP
jgi:hypothetical protein